MPDDADPAEARRLDDVARMIAEMTYTPAELAETFRRLAVTAEDRGRLRWRPGRRCTRRGRRRIDGGR